MYIINMDKICKNISFARTIFYDWCEVTTCAGIYDWHTSKNTLSKICWTIILLIGFTLTFWQTSLVLKNFVSDSHYVTTLSIGSGEPLPFPNITVCNFNRINQRKIGTIDEDVLSYGFEATFINYYKNLNVSSDQIDNLQQRWIELKRKLGIDGLDTLFQKFGYTCPETIVECKYDADYKSNCCNDAHEEVKSSGRCWTVSPTSNENSQVRYAQKSAGVDYGVELILNPMVNSYLKNVVANNHLEVGFKVSVSFDHQQQLLDYLVAQPGYHYWIKMKPILNTMKDELITLWSKNCRQNEVLSILDVAYSKANCDFDCWAQIFVEKCNCTVAAPLKPSYKICSTDIHLRCVNNFCLKQPDFCDERLTECRKGCKNPCQPYWTIEASQTSAKFINQHNLERMLNNWSDEQLSLENEMDRNQTIKNLIRLEIFYPTLDYLQVETGEAFPLFAFIANIGGQLSLLLGMSIITIIQAICYICRCCLTNSTKSEDKNGKVVPNSFMH